jgi:hypothetical protein
MSDGSDDFTAPPRQRRRPWRLAALLVILAALVAAAVFIVLDNDRGQRDTTADDEAGTDDETSADDTIDANLFQCVMSAGGRSLGMDEGSIPDADLDRQVQAIAEIIETERGLTAGDDVDIEFVSLDEVQKRAVESAMDELDESDADVGGRVLATLGAVEPGTDLFQSQLDALDAGVGGFYQPETGQLVIGSESMDGMGAFVTAHELVHAMADAQIGLPDTREIAERHGADAAYAALGAIEGDATLYSQQFIVSHLPLTDLLALEAESGETMAAMDGLPHFVSRSLTFPYDEGMIFTCDVFLDGGWEAVDETYRMVPETTAQILFPDRYRAGEPAVAVRDVAGPAGWDELDTDTFGAADLLFLLEAPGDNPAAALSDPKDRVAAWAGGRYTIWADGEANALGLVLAEHAEPGEYGLCDTVTDYYAAAFPAAERSDDGADTTFADADQVAVIACDGAEVALGIGPDLATATATIAASE